MNISVLNLCCLLAESFAVGLSLGNAIWAQIRFNEMSPHLQEVATSHTFAKCACGMTIVLLLSGILRVVL